MFTSIKLITLLLILICIEANASYAFQSNAPVVTTGAAIPSNSHIGSLPSLPGATPIRTTTTIGPIPNLGPGSTTTITSVPYGYGNSSGSISSSDTQFVPVIINTYGTPYWIWINSGGIPTNAIIYQYVNFVPVYYCRIQNGNRLFYGYLVPREGCYIPGEFNQPFTYYQILVR